MKRTININWYKIFAIAFLIVCFFKCSLANGQKPDSIQKQKTDSIALLQKETNAFVDSLVSKTSIKQFQAWCDESVSSKTYREGKFSELYDMFLRQKYNAWLQKRSNPKTLK